MTKYTRYQEEAVRTAVKRLERRTRRLGEAIYSQGLEAAGRELAELDSDPVTDALVIFLVDRMREQEERDTADFLGKLMRDAKLGPYSHEIPAARTGRPVPSSIEIKATPGEPVEMTLTYDRAFDRAFDETYRR
jgi:hypothetical protein